MAGDWDELGWAGKAVNHNGEAKHRKALWWHLLEEYGNDWQLTFSASLKTQLNLKF